MFCKNLIAYDINKDNFLSQLNNELLQRIAYTPCSPVDSVKSGFISPLDNDELMIEINGQVLLKYQTERKILPSNVVNRAVNEKAQRQEAVLNRKLKKSEKLTLKDEVMLDLLPKAFSKFEQFFVWIDKTNKTISVTVSSFKKSEDVLAHLRKELGSLAVTPICSEQPAEKILTKWLQGNKPSNFEVCDSAVLCDLIEPNSKIKLINEHITDSREVQSYIDDGRAVESLSIAFNKGVKFTIKRDLTLSKITFDPCIMLEDNDFMPYEKERRIETDFIIATDVLSSLITEIKTAFI